MHNEDRAGRADDGQDGRRAGRRADDEAPRTVIDGRYELLERIGSGGMGEVWKAHDRRLNRYVAVKGLLDRNAMTPGTQATAMQRARREAEAIAKIEHQNVVTVHDQVETDHQVWIVMKLLEARSLADLLSRDGVLAVPRAATIGLQVLQGLRAVHAASVVHRDVKPGNVLVRDDGLAILVDFGIATFEGADRVTRTGSVIGTPSYLAPELFAPASPGPTPASDLWALGVTLYEAVEGRVPFAGHEVWEVQENVRQSPDPVLRYAGPLAPVIQGLLITEPRERLDAATAEAMLREVLDDPASPDAGTAAAATHPPTAVSTPAPSTPPTPAPGTAVRPPEPVPPSAAPSGQRARYRGWQVAAAVVCVALLAGAGWLVAQGDGEDGKQGEGSGSAEGQGQAGSGSQERWKDTHPTLEIGVKDDQPGLSKFDRKTRTYRGYDIDLAYAIAESMGYGKGEVAFTTVATDYRSTALKTKQVDLVIASYSITDDRKTAGPDGYSVDFAGPYYEASRGFLVREKSAKYTINDSSDLRDLGVEVCTARESTYEKALPKQGFTMAKSQPNTYQDCLDKLLDPESEVYAVASDDIILAGYVEANPGKVRRLENIQGAEGYGVAMRPGTPTLKREVCSALRTILAGRVWEDMYKENLSGLVGDKNPPGRPELTECEGF
ncbi:MULTISPECIES: serine/threonine-protein kinase [Streptomyces albovinaceus subgroup]|uniref:serine/threonine-protein kinase n=1 Tax=Streptomyces albovinaceus subgroup TaxID=1482558 RepID=UPI0004C82F14|nr:serine/threonine-protein kinase [Streptomyces mediolani]WSF77339.1 serine/threonine-protein kinase [Streptomyces globisporus]WSV90435.1 serine/threonine-protein kinase [Streptomyces globisporus]